MIVIDASALVELLVSGTPRAARIAARVTARRETLHAPHLIDLEVISAVRTLERGLGSAVASRAVSDLLAVALTRYAHELFIPRIWQLRANLTPYDACYVALAESLAAPLVTCDARLAASPGTSAVIELF
jgi:predicted nucleic acid-binding protein